jgi:hypothetical protein
MFTKAVLWLFLDTASQIRLFDYKAVENSIARCLTPWMARSSNTTPKAQPAMQSAAYCMSARIVFPARSTFGATINIDHYHYEIKWKTDNQSKSLQRPKSSVKLNENGISG